jgi:hypothetical protein
MNPRSVLRVEVPDERHGSMLVQQLSGSDLAGSDLDGWAVIGSLDGDLPDALTAIQAWLRDTGIEQTVVHVGDRPHTMTRDCGVRAAVAAGG